MTSASADELFQSFSTGEQNFLKWLWLMTSYIEIEKSKQRLAASIEKSKASMKHHMFVGDLKYVSYWPVKLLRILRSLGHSTP